MNVLKTSLVMVTPADPKEAEELTTIMSRLEAAYGKGKWCKDAAKPDACLNIDEITEIMADVARRETAARGLGGLAHDCAADEEGLRALRRAVEQGRERAGLRRHRRDVAREVRHAARRVHRRSSTGCGTQVQPLYLKLHAYVRDEAAREVRRRRAGEGADSRASARQHLGAGLGQRLSARRAAERGRRLLARPTS